jgi:PAS domain S-box-containing protein
MDGTSNAVSGLRVLVVEDEMLTAKAIRDVLTHSGCEVVDTVDTGQGAIAVAASARPDLVLMDVQLNGEMDGVQAAELIYERLQIPVVYLTAHSDHSTLQRARGTATFGCVLKPFRIQNLLATMEVAVHRFRTEQRLKESELTHETILGSISDGVIATDTEARIRFMNPVAEQLTGWPLWEAQGQPLDAVLRLEDAAGELSQLRLVARVLAAHDPVHFDGSDFVVARGRERVPVDGAVSRVVDGLGRGTTISSLSRS